MAYVTAQAADSSSTIYYLMTAYITLQFNFHYHLYTTFCNIYCVWIQRWKISPNIKWHSDKFKHRTYWKTSSCLRMNRGKCDSCVYECVCSCMCVCLCVLAKRAYMFGRFFSLSCFFHRYCLLFYQQAIWLSGHFSSHKFQSHFHFTHTYSFPFESDFSVVYVPIMVFDSEPLNRYNLYSVNWMIYLVLRFI